MNKEGFDYSDKIEAYIRNELSTSERSDFEKLLRQDPVLRSELLLQQEIISTIRSQRKAELKQRLDRIQIKGSSSSTSGALTVAGAIIGGAAIVGIASMLMINEAENAENNAAIEQTTSMATSKVPTLTPKNTQEIPASSSVTKAEKEQKIALSQKKSIATTKPKNTIAEKSTTQTPPVVAIEEFLLDNIEESIQKDGDINLPDERITSSITSPENQLIIVDNSNSKYKLHYQYTNRQLSLYGFDKPYRIIDVLDTTNEGKQSYLFYNGRYYKLDENQREIGPLQEVTNPQLIKELKQKKDRMSLQ